MKHTMIVFALLAALVACTPETSDVTVPSSAGRFARITIAADRNKTLVGLRNTLDDGILPFLSFGMLANQEGFRTNWTVVGGQSATVYMRIEPTGDTSIIRILTEPSPPPFPELLARDLDRLAKVIIEKLGLQSYKLEPDR